MKLFICLNVFITLCGVLGAFLSESSKPDNRQPFWFKLHFSFAAFLWFVMALVNYTETISLTIGVYVLIAMTVIMWMLDMVYHDAKDSDEEGAAWFFTIVVGVAWLIYFIVQFYF